MSTIALFAALGGGAYAASTFVGPSGVVNLCVSKSGTVKVLAAKKSKCGKGASLVPINQTGPAGKQGPAGTPGATAAATYSAGSGLTLSGTTFGADLSKVQARIAGSGCAGDQALQSVSQSGTPTCVGLHGYESPPNVAIARPGPSYLDRHGQRGRYLLAAGRRKDRGLGQPDDRGWCHRHAESDRNGYHDRIIDLGSDRMHF
jgi:hypothetical protein